MSKVTFMEEIKPSDFIQGSLFEENYLIRTLGGLVTYPEVALTELVANAWDAGATTVDISIPNDHRQKLIIEDNGTGLTKDQFHYRWMRLGYDRLKHQGKKVVFPSEVQSQRVAYGRNGIGRHGLLCFNNEYRVITIAQGTKSTFIITTRSEAQPFVIKDESFAQAQGHGTRLEVKVIKNLPKPEKILDVISARFLHDPKFLVTINKQSVPLEQHSGLIDTKELTYKNIKLKVHFIDSHAAAKSTLYQGIAFWQGGRLVGEPSWVLGNNVVIDGRTKFAKRFTVVVKTDDLADYVREDWTGFKKSEVMDQVYQIVDEYVNEMFKQLAMENIDETKQQIKNEFAKDLANLSPLGKYEVNEAIEAITAMNPTAKPEAVSLAVEAIISLEKTRTGKELLSKLSQLSEDDITGLNQLLDKWTIKDALTVLDEIDNRISVIEAIRKLSGDKDVDELHVLHPLVTNARWLFGPEYDSPEFVCNKQLQNAIEMIFKKKVDKELFLNHKKRPDLIVLKDSTASVTGTESFHGEGNLSTLNRVLLIELKKGGFKLTRKERNQAQGYVEDFISCGAIIGTPFIDAFVVGESFSEQVQPSISVKNHNDVEQGKIRITTFGQLVDTAERRLFGLRQRLNDRYDDISGMELFGRATQMKVPFEQSKNPKG